MQCFGQWRRCSMEPIAYMYHDCTHPTDVRTLLHSALIVLAVDRRADLRGETELFTREQFDSEMKELRQQRDELVAALKDILQCPREQTSFGAAIRARAERNGFAAVAKAEGGAEARCRAARHQIRGDVDARSIDRRCVALRG